MTTAEKKIAADLLRLAAEQFSNHGCNDFDLSGIIPEKDDRDDLVRCYHSWNGDPEEYYDSSSSRDYRLGDWQLMDFLAHRLERDL